jgi:hypothetical protein
MIKNIEEKKRLRSIQDAFLKENLPAIMGNEQLKKEFLIASIINFYKEYNFGLVSQLNLEEIWRHYETRRTTN